ncbi:MAG: AAA family ATPase [Planctomycetales bacterium]|nr:AAA family ATPase [Planctomycetales bacterium]
MASEISASYITGNDVFSQWWTSIEAGEKPLRYCCGEGDLSKIHIGPGRVVLIGGAPGAGKTTLTMQLIVDALRMDDSLRACVANVEVSPATLLDRQLARISGIPATRIQNRELSDEFDERLQIARAALESAVGRIAFVSASFDLQNIASAADDFDANIIVLDYIQRIRTGADETAKAGIDRTMDYVRKFADVGFAIVVVSAVGRSKDRYGRSSYDSADLSLASFRESSELEFGADDAYILAETKDGMLLRHLKARYSEPHDIALEFHRSCQSFKAIDPFEWIPDANADRTKNLESLWGKA